MRIIDGFPLPIKTVSEARKKAMEADLRKSNRVLLRCHEAAKKAGFAGNRRSFFADLSKGVDHGVAKDDVDEILRSKRLEHEFLSVYSRMIFKISRRLSARLDKTLSRDDICAVAMEGFLKAFCCFTDENIRFSSYLTHCVERHIFRFANSFQNQFRVPLKTFKLRAKVLRIMSEQGLTFDSALEKMNLAKKTRSVLIQSMFDVINLGVGSDIVAEEKTSTIADFLDISEVVDNFRCEFSGLDGLVFDELVKTGGEMNLSETSRRTTNPKTGKPYTRMAMSVAWKRVRGKICERYGKVA